VPSPDFLCVNHQWWSLGADLIPGRSVTAGVARVFLMRLMLAVARKPIALCSLVLVH